MIDLADSPPTAQKRRGISRAAVSRGWRAGIILGMASFILFALVTRRLVLANFVSEGVELVWDNPNTTGSMGGQWLQAAFIWLVKQFPGSNIATLSIITICGGAFAQGFIGHDLVKRGWTPLQAALAVGLTALHPVMLFYATSGSPTLMYAIGASFLIIALDRFEAIGDTQSLIILGLVIAGLTLSWPNSIYFVLPFLVLLPWAFKAIESYASALALFVIVIMPTLIVLTAMALGGTLFKISVTDVFMVWAAPLHGAPMTTSTTTGWLETNGGHFFAPLIFLLALCITTLPRSLIVLERFLFKPSERANPTTGLAAFFLPPLSGALATYFWHLLTPMPVLAVTLFCTTAWATTVNFRNWERWLWIASIFAGTILAWFSPLLWNTKELITWRQIVFG